MRNRDAPSASVWFDMTDGTVKTRQNNVIYANTIDYKNGWYRCYMIYTATSSLKTNWDIGTSPIDGVTRYTASADIEEFHFFGADFSPHAGFVGAARAVRL